MKNLIYFFIVGTIILTNIGYARVQRDISDKQAINMLNRFYTAYLTAWSTTKNPKQLVPKLDSLQKKYCTVKLRKKLKVLFNKAGLDHDVLINDEATDVKHLKTLKVVKDSTRINSYIVSYIDHTISPSYKPIDKTVVVHVTVVNEENNIKIDSVYGDAISLQN